MSIKYVGRTTDFRGNNLWDIVSNLRNFGVGRVVVRSMFERYEEKSFMRILQVEALPEPAADSQQQRKVKVLMDKVFRGEQFDKPVWVSIASYKADFRLLSKKEEASYCKIAKREEKIIAPYMEFPPLLKEFVMNETGRSDVMMKVKHKPKIYSTARLAQEGETPNVVVVMGIGKPHPKASILYEGLNI